MFFKSKKAPKPESNEELSRRLADTIQVMRSTAENLDKRAEHLARQKDECRVKGKKLLAAKNKEGAKYQLTLMKKYEKEVESLQGKKLNLESQIMALESTSVDKDILNAMRAGRDMMRAVINDQNLDNAMDIMDDIQDVYSQQEELSSVLARPVGEQIDIDDDELLREFEELDEAVEEEANYNLDSLPMAPSTTKKQQVAAEPVNEVDEEARQLAALMGL